MLPTPAARRARPKHAHRPTTIAVRHTPEPQNATPPPARGLPIRARRILRKGGEGWDVMGIEGCLSIPDYIALVRRNRWLEVQYSTLAGKSITARVTGT